MDKQNEPAVWPYAPQAAPTPPEPEPPQKPRKEKLTRRERRRRWKAAKKAKRAEQKEYYRYAPWPKRWWNLYLRRPLGVLLVLALLAVILAEPLMELAGSIFSTLYYEMKDRPLTEEDIPRLYELAPLDEEGARRIAAYPAVGADETWTICVYLVGSNLEDENENDLSYVTQLLTKEARAENNQRFQTQRMENLTRFNSELKARGLELPAFFYYPDKPVASTTTVTEEVTVAERPGAASVDITEMAAETWSDNISLVIQTGGATRWGNQSVNPNRTQRFLYRGGQFTEVANLALEPPSEPETLAEFLRFCRDRYPADHTMLVLWNHGGGPFGYGNDSIYDGMFTLSDIREALSAVYAPDRSDPAFDIIGFDACLMSTLEVTHALDGFAEFYCLSEETEPGDGWHYTPVLQAMTADPTMSPAAVAQKIADSYVDYYMRENINFPILQTDVTFSVIDAAKAEELYEAYCALCQAQLLDAVDDLSVLADIGRCAGRATRYAGSYYNVYNTVDLGNYMDYLIDTYPEQSSRVRELEREAVLYHRQNGGLSDSTGIAVYVPTEVSTVPGLLYYLDYIYNISEDPAVTALYYYKQAGCLNDELREALSGLTDKEPQVLDVAAFRQFSKVTPTFDEVGFALPVSEQLQSLMVSREMELGCYDEDEHVETYYGREDCLWLDGEGKLLSEFDGTWICMDGQPLYVEPVSSTGAATEYRAHVLYDGDEAYLELSCDRDSGEICITGVRLVPTGLGEDVNYLTNTRGSTEVEYGAKITPIYEQTDHVTNSTEYVYGWKISFTRNTTLRREPLPDGYYLCSAVIADPRGDHYYSVVMGAELSRGALSNWRTDERFFRRDYL